MPWVFEKWTVDGVDDTRNPVTVVMNKNITVVAHYQPEVVYVSYVVENPKSTPQTIKIVSTKEVVVPANGSTTITLAPGDKIVLPAA